MDLHNHIGTDVSLVNHQWIQCMHDQGFSVKYITEKPFTVILWKGLKVECMGISQHSMEKAVTQCRQRSGWKTLVKKPRFAQFHLN